MIEASGRNNPAVICELLGGAARLKGITGVVVNGAVRDSSRLAQWPDFAVFTRWITPRGPSSMERGTVNQPIALAGVCVAPYDLVLGDVERGLSPFDSRNAPKLGVVLAQ